MFKYTIKAYNYDQTVGAVEIIQVIVTAPDEEKAIKRAAMMVQRTNFSVLAIEDIRGSQIKKRS